MPEFLEKKKTNNLGFTLVELLAVVFTIALISALVFPNYKKGAQQMALERSAHKLYQDMRRVQEMSISSAQYGSTVPNSGYGIRIETATSIAIYCGVSAHTGDPTKYIIYAHNDTDPNNYFYCLANGDVIVEEIKLEKGVVIKSINDGANPHVCINIRPPLPEIGLMSAAGGNKFPVDIKITLALKDDLTKTKNIYINTKGLIYEKQ